MSNKADNPGAPEVPPGNIPESQPGGTAADKQADGPAESPVNGDFQQTPANRDYLDGFLFDAPPGTLTGKEADANAGTQDASAGDSIEERVIDALRTIYDPEIPVNIYDLGLIYGVAADASAHVVVTMTLTTPHCPVAEIMPGEVERRTGDVEGVCGVTVNLVWDPPWDPSRMTEEAQLELGFI